MKVDLSMPITNLDGSPIGPGLTVGEACANALLMTHPGDEDLPSENKVYRFLLAGRFSRSGVQDVFPAEMGFALDYVTRAYGPLIVGQVALADPRVRSAVPGAIWDRFGPDGVSTEAQADASARRD